jgi:ubiquinone biosynthesis protein UbiJ
MESNNLRHLKAARRTLRMKGGGCEEPVVNVRRAALIRIADDLSDLESLLDSTNARIARMKDDLVAVANGEARGY